MKKALKFSAVPVVMFIAVRDLWGTVNHEGAMKGILITTSSFGPYSYAFAKDKPITLLDGANLVHMLMEQGLKTYIGVSRQDPPNTQITVLRALDLRALRERWIEQFGIAPSCRISKWPDGYFVPA